MSSLDKGKSIFADLQTQHSIAASIIVSTYNSPSFLDLVLHGYAQQTSQNFEVIVADDGSLPATKELVDSWIKKGVFPIKYVWQEDDGFQKNRILNAALRLAVSDYILVADGDCIPLPDYLEQHLQLREPGSFISGGVVHASRAVTESITLDDVTSRRCFTRDWLHDLGMKPSRTRKFSIKKAYSRFMDHFTPTGATWDGGSSSGWKKDIVAVNGFDERLQHGGEDRELGERLINAGIRPIQCRHRAVALHLWHERPYKKPEMKAFVDQVRKEVRSKKLIWTEHGLKHGPQA